MAEKIYGYRCISCNSLHEDVDDAAHCCGPKSDIFYRCEVCGRDHDWELWADECCAGW